MRRRTHDKARPPTVLQYIELKTGYEDNGPAAAEEYLSLTGEKPGSREAPRDP